MKVLEMYMHNDLESEIIQPFCFLQRLLGETQRKFQQGIQERQKSSKKML